MYQSKQQFSNKQMNIVWKYRYMFRPCWVIIRQLLHLYDTRYWVVYRYESRSLIYKFFVIRSIVKFKL
jgi:hypothetical protein